MVVGVVPGTGGKSVRKELDAEVRPALMGVNAFLTSSLGSAHEYSVGTTANTDRVA
jgi:chorismate synthase